jgi:hypothetical protein
VCACFGNKDQTLQRIANHGAAHQTKVCIATGLALNAAIQASNIILRDLTPKPAASICTCCSTKEPQADTRPPEAHLHFLLAAGSSQQQLLFLPRQQLQPIRSTPGSCCCLLLLPCIPHFTRNFPPAWTIVLLLVKFTVIFIP